VIAIAHIKIIAHCRARKRRASQPTRRCEINNVGAVFYFAPPNREADGCVRGGGA
jgi:hypothetical protein